MKTRASIIALLLLTATLAGQACASDAAGPVAIAIHAGAGSMSREDFSPEMDARIRARLEQAVRAGHEVLTSGGSSLDAVSEAVTILEDAPFFNAGRGAVFNSEGLNELDASIMDGQTLNAGAVAGVEPRVMGLGPVFAIQKALARANLTLADMDVIEINEAFDTQVLGCLKMLDVDFTDSRVNPNGGAIAIGHPLGASGARIALTTMRHLERTRGRYAAISLCIGIGQGVAAIIERLD